MKNIDKLVTDIVQEKLDKVDWPCENTIEKDINIINASFVVLKNDFSKLRDKSDHMIGSLTYLSSEYDDFMENFARISLDNQRLTKEVEQMKYKQLRSEKQLDQLEQYRRREDLEIHGVPRMKNENTNQIIKTVAKILNVTLEDNHISTSHRLIQTGNNSSTAQQNRTNAALQHPPIIVRFSDRDKGNEIFRRRSFLRDNAEVKACFASQNIALKKI